MHEWIGTALAVAAGLWAVFTTLTLYGFRTGRFLQKGDDDVAGIRDRQVSLIKRVDESERAVEAIGEAIRSRADETARDMGRLGFKYELMEQRLTIEKAHADERHARLEDRLDRIEKQISDLQRQIDTSRT